MQLRCPGEYLKAMAQESRMGYFVSRTADAASAHQDFDFQIIDCAVNDSFSSVLLLQLDPITTI